MFFHYLKVALRNLWKYRLQSVICIIGLAVGMTCFALSSLWFNYINSFEDFIQDADRTYLLSEGSAKYSPDHADYGVRDAIAEKVKALEEYCPEIEKVYIWYDGVVKLNDIDGAALTKGPSDLYRILNLNILFGRGELLNPTEIIVSRKWAVENLGQVDVVGQSLTHKDWANRPIAELKIVGVYDDLPANTALFSQNDCFGLWNGMARDVYRVVLWVKLYKGADVDMVAKKAADTKVNVSYFSNFVGGEVTEDINLKFNFLPLRELRVYYPQTDYSFSSSYVLLFCAIGLLVIFSALCNYYITMIAQVRIRCRALAIRRMLGSGKWGIVWMNIVETLLIFVLSSLLGAFIIFLVKPDFVEYAELEGLGTVSFIAQVVLYCLAVLVGCVALTAFTTLYTMRLTQRSILYGHQSHRSSSLLDMVSNVVQISLSLCILFCVMVIIGQVHYLRDSRDLGYEKHNVLSIFRCPPSLMDHIMSSPLVVDTVLSAYPVLPMDMLRPVKIGADSKSNELMDVSMVSIIPKEIDFWGLKLKEGRVPRKDSHELLINESMAMKLDKDSIVGSTIDIYDYSGTVSYTVTGILKNVYSQSVTGEPGELLYSYTSDFGEGQGITFKVAEGSKSKMIADIEAFMAKEGIEDQVYRFVDNEERFEEVLYKESLLLNVLIVIAGVSLIVSLFGVFSLLSLSLEQRRKEIALRKVHGATIRQVLTMFLKRQFVTLLIGAFIAFPIGYVIMKEWLSSYIQQMPIAWWFMPLILLVMATVVFLTIFGCINAAVKQNPAEVIKNE